MYKILVKDVIEAYEADIEYLRNDKKNTNRTKLIQRNALMLQFLRTVPEDLRISCEGTISNHYKLNAGSLTECILRYHMNKAKPTEIAKAGGAWDAKRGFFDVEIKLSVNGSCYNTPIQVPCLTYLVNRTGVYMMRKAEVLALPPKAKLPFIGGGERIEWLSKAMGYDVEETEE